MINSMEFLPVIYLCGVIEFQARLKVSENLLYFFTQFFNYGITSAGIFLCATGYLVLFKREMPKQALSEASYEDAKTFFRTDYDLVNPIT